MAHTEYRRSTNPTDDADWSRRQVLLTDLRAVGGRAYPRVTGMFREKSWIFFEILLPFIATSAFVFVYRSLQAPPEYVGFVVLGGAMTAFWLNVIWMMASQLYWEKSQGNLELYFAAPMSFMSILFGMALGGMVMSTTRAIVILAIASLVYGVTFSVDQWLLLGVVFVLTLTALYGLGMMLASLFLVWGREANQLTELFTEPVYFVSGLNFPVGRLGLLGALAIATIPLAVGLDAMRQLAFVGTALPFGTPSPEVEALILVAMTCRVPPRRPLDARGDGADGPPRRPPVDPMAVIPAEEVQAPPGGLGSPDWGGFDAARTRGRGLADGWRSFRTAAKLGWRMEANWTDPILFFIYSVAKPLSASLILVVILDIVSGGSSPEYRAFVVIGTALWSFVMAAIAGLAWSILDDRERYRMLKYVYVSPSDFMVILVGRGVARLGRRRDGYGHHDRLRHPRPGHRVRSGGRLTGRCSRS